MNNVKESIKNFIEDEKNWYRYLDVEFILDSYGDAKITIMVIPLNYKIVTRIAKWYTKRRAIDCETNLSVKKDTYLFNDQTLEKLRDFAYNKNKYKIERFGHNFSPSQSTKKMLEDISVKNRVDIYTLYDILMDSLFYHEHFPKQEK